MSKRSYLRTVAVVVSLAWGCSGPESASPRRRVVSAEQARTDELMRQNASRASEPELADAYETINVRYFDGRLPAVRIRWEEGLDSIGPLIAEGFRLEGLTDGKVILLHPSLQKDARQLKAVLCHEMVHVALREGSAAHGPEFQSRLRSLSEAGAFEGVVATDEEKEQLKNQLEKTSRRLSNELGDLRELQARIEADAPSLTREVVQDQIWSFNRRVRQHNEDAESFNRDVDRYNLMITYPDGLDRERLAGKPGAQEISR